MDVVTLVYSEDYTFLILESNAVTISLVLLFHCYFKEIVTFKLIDCIGISNINSKIDHFTVVCLCDVIYEIFHILNCGCEIN